MLYFGNDDEVGPPIVKVAAMPPLCDARIEHAHHRDKDLGWRLTFEMARSCAMRPCFLAHAVTHSATRNLPLHIIEERGTTFPPISLFLVRLPCLYAFLTGRNQSRGLIVNRAIPAARALSNGTSFNSFNCFLSVTLPALISEAVKGPRTTLEAIKEGGSRFQSRPGPHFAKSVIMTSQVGE